MSSIQFKLIHKICLDLECEKEDLHTFNTETCNLWYETRPDDGRVMDVRFNDERIKRTLLGDRPKGTKTEIWLGKQLKGDDLINSYTRHTKG